ncbi:MAG: hypothetical protein ACJA0T_001877 [Colwellia sp.]
MSVISGVINGIVDEQQGKYFIRTTEKIDKSHGDL